MAFYKVEDTEVERKPFIAWVRVGKEYMRARSDKTIALTTWKCYSCKSMVVTFKGDKPPTVCGMCKAR